MGRNLKIAFDEGYSFGKGFFETIDVEEGTAVDLARHVRRINRSLKDWQMDQCVSEKEIAAYIRDEHIWDGALKLMVSDKNRFYSVRENPYRGKERTRRLNLKISPVLRNSTSRLVRYKTLSVYENIALMREAKAEGYDEILFLNEKGHVCEGAVTNIFFVDKAGGLVTPPVSDGLLPGTKREAVMEKMCVTERPVAFSELSDFCGAFLTNALMGAVEVGKIGQQTFDHMPERILDIQNRL